VMLTLPLTSTMLATLLLGVDGLQVMPVVIVAVVVAYVVTARLTPAEPQERDRPAKEPTSTPMTVTK
jgi:UDP-N-acetylmuramyl pentapeptide phosphotransferase/UDP-N-acetylglucosamine-1-phosphate transferase